VVLCRIKIVEAVHRFGCARAERANFISALREQSLGPFTFPFNTTTCRLKVRRTSRNATLSSPYDSRSGRIVPEAEGIMKHATEVLSTSRKLFHDAT
jgi:hypothetical protein